MLLRRVWPSRPSFEGRIPDQDRARREILRWLDALADEPFGREPSSVFPPMNVSQDADAFYVRCEMPGVDPKQLDLSVVKDRLSISGHRELPKETAGVSYHRKERAEGSFSRSVTLPAEVAADHVDASYDDGILTVRLPKAEIAKPRQITVKT